MSDNKDITKDITNDNDINEDLINKKLNIMFDDWKQAQENKKEDKKDEPDDGKNLLKDIKQKQDTLKQQEYEKELLENKINFKNTFTTEVLEKNKDILGNIGFEIYEELKEFSHDDFYIKAKESLIDYFYNQDDTQDNLNELDTVNKSKLKKYLDMYNSNVPSEKEQSKTLLDECYNIMSTDLHNRNKLNKYKSYKQPGVKNNKSNHLFNKALSREQFVEMRKRG